MSIKLGQYSKRNTMEMKGKIIKELFVFSGKKEQNLRKK